MTKKERTEKVEFWRQQLEGFLASGLSVKDYCARQGISVANWYYWRKRLGKSSGPRVMISGAEEFLPVRLAEMSSSMPVEVQLLSGRRLKFSAPLDSAWL
ncbi:IS66 family insertion sequence element accessory protein TnpB [Acidithiobacillus sp. CV18-2]|uniref:IS66 family insertion sequence element accessory protein TnpB n=1 Tax=Igneacidithiobacillus copahuensis TaxID=2724909 RepID=A0AAE2YRG8_9PROT|nr:IS66 family insertion sequence element accessory protein TnpB [Igneacidithiobacillus copahuensis]MBU2755421.1 IS66 family insertion sequence element accessory protein TnpB [Acidithiobacillus sp. CV18-3]MBU2758213.1 IS66 family insertion sequence element accessory protein TnpB [Acidithiobacillus sp. BN09-2]MBU2776285.1 IS66 family insertion sequence element accessory protein TnpB [Acidithiobacillus sp. CV18-2]MBU2796760.1 IS66 family insertion sequence element accessory protein TnpB [Acidithi